MAWDDVIEYDGNESMPDPVPARLPTEELILYLQTLFEPDDHVGYVTNDAWKNEDGKWVPAKGVCDRTAGELIESLQKHPDDLGATIGDWKPEAGAWIRFNALDGEGVRNDNVTSFRFALVESDNMPVDEQLKMYRKMELPIAALVSSAHKSVHAIVRVDAEDLAEYRKRVTFLYDFLSTHGIKVDTQNRNPSRLSRMPGVTRNGIPQKLLGVNVGRRSWVDWLDFVEGVTDELPQLAPLSQYVDQPPVLPEELIKGVLRRGHKMLISGSSKAGKSFLLMELCISIAEGQPWLGFRCEKGRVLYVNLEIDPASCINRFMRIYRALGIKQKHADDIIIWNLRGHAVPLDQLVPKLIRRVRDQHLDAIIIDPIYKIITGDENSKGAQGAKRAMDRASGSGVFARDPDAQLDMIELAMDEVTQNVLADSGATAWRLEGSLREFENFTPVDFWFSYPVHRVDPQGSLSALPAIGSPAAGRLSNAKSKTAEECASEFRMAYQSENMDGHGVSVKDMAVHLGLAERTIRERVQKMAGEFILADGMIYLAETPNN